MRDTTRSKFIVTTTINEPTEALRSFAEMDGWRLVVVADTTTPVDAYRDIDCDLLTVAEQQDRWPDLSEAIGWRCIQRRNLGFIHAHAARAEVVATVDDDNIPLDGWGTDVAVGREVDATSYTAPGIAADPLSVTNHPHLWHRGFPLQDVAGKNQVVSHGTVRVVPDVQADLWNGDPDVDAACRMTMAPDVEFDQLGFTTFTNDYVPFNSQNTFISRTMLPSYMCLPGVGRMDDIWGAYLLEEMRRPTIVFGPASVRQDRNDHDLTVDFEREVLGYTKTPALLERRVDLAAIGLPQVRDVFDMYRACFD